jgi:hypothetical protein
MIVRATSSSSRLAIKLREFSKTTTVHKSVAFPITKTLLKRLQTASNNTKNRPYMADFPEYIEKVKKTLVLVKNIVSLREITGVSRMSTDSKIYLTPEEYLHRERTAEYRSECYRGETFAMAGACSHLREQLKKKPCQACVITS